MILFFVSLIAGALTALAPCTLALLPIIVGGSLSGGSSLRRSVVVVSSLGASVILFTLLLKVSTAFINVPQEFWQYLSGLIIACLGLTMIFPALWDRMPGLNHINRDASKLMSTGFQKQNFFGDVLVGSSLGPVFSSCSPTYFLILATVLPRSVGAGVIYLLAYTVGLCSMLFIVAFAGQKLLENLGLASDPRGLIKRGIGVLFFIIGVIIFYGYDKKIAVSANYFDETKIEQYLLSHNDPPPMPTLRTAPMSGDQTAGDIRVATTTDSAVIQPNATTPSQTSAPTLSDTARKLKKSALYPKAPEITNPSGYINTAGKPITIGEFKGKKVVLVDFWTYSCINCQRTLPYLKAWDDKYRDQGLEIIGIHTPEFAFEHVLGNVQKAVDGFGLKYPSVLDNDYGTWNAFANSFWPRKYLIDIDGYIVYDHAGEGNYDTTEMAIQKALKERAEVLKMNETISSGTVAPKDAIPVSASGVGSSETYFGSARNEYFGNGVAMTNGTQELTTPTIIELNALYLSGKWRFESEYASSLSAGSIIYRFRAKDVYLVASSPVGVRVMVILDGKPIGTDAGADVAADGTITIKENRLYTLVHLPTSGTHTLELKVERAGLDAYTFTFG